MKVHQNTKTFCFKFSGVIFFFEFNLCKVVVTKQIMYLNLNVLFVPCSFYF